MSDFVLLLIGAGVGLGMAVTAALLRQAAERYVTRRIDAAVSAAEGRIVEKALGMVRDITQVRAATPASITPHLDAIQAERAAWALGREKALAAASDSRFNDELKGKKP